MGRLAMLPFVFNHVVLPPRLPGRRESENTVPEVERDLTRRLLLAVETVKASSDEKFLPAWDSIAKSLRACNSLNENGYVNKEALLGASRDMKPGDLLIVYLAQQNACLLIRRPHLDEGTVLFEAFETSATAEQALTSEGALQWDFPGVAASLPATEFGNPLFLENLMAFIEKASLEPIEEFAPTTRKAGAAVSESRDTVHPALITQFLMTVLETNGCRADPQVLRKRVKDDVCWENAELPWRRSPFWLALRVCTQRFLYLRLGAELGRMQYKFMICSLMASLLDDSLINIEPERCNFLKAKLCRRMAKLKTESDSSTVAAQQAYKRLSAGIGTRCQDSIYAATVDIEKQWEVFKKQTQRKIPSLPSYARDSDLRLELSNSFSYLREILRTTQSHEPDQHAVNPNAIREHVAPQQFTALATFHSSVADMESSIESESPEIPEAKADCEVRCQDLATQIGRYLSAVGNAYDQDPEQMSVFILCLLELWVRMDKCATVAYPLLKDYHPWLTPELFDVLLLSCRRHFERLRRIQLHLHDRCERAGGDTMTIFTNPITDCFSDRHFKHHATDEDNEFEHVIHEASIMSEEKKATELKKVNEKFKDLTDNIATSACTRRENPDGTHDIRGCNHCYYVRRRRRLKIQVHEDFLPSKSKLPERRAVLFELNLPKTFAIYRDTTWNIIATLFLQAARTSYAEPKMLIGRYSQLKRYNRDSRSAGVTLASTTKSYLRTHYNWKRLPASDRSVLLPFGLRFLYYDSGRKIWLDDSARLTLAPWFAIKLPKHCPFSKIYPRLEADGPAHSSYEAIASINACPSDLSVNDFIAHQNLMGGRNKRWLSILIELGSSNVNFSLFDTMILFRHLALQAGPELDGDDLRAIHCVFRDAQFCKRLIEQIQQHVDLILSNWRETNYMETLLTMTIQLCNFCCPELRNEAHALLLSIRRITHGWVTMLHIEARNAQEVDAAENAARYCFLSALFCRRTFVLCAYDKQEIDREAFECFTKATLAMQESLVVDTSKFSTTTLNMFVRDIKISFAMRPAIRDFVTRLPMSLGPAIDKGWPIKNNKPRTYTEWELLPCPYEWWVMSTAQSAEIAQSQVVQYHLLEGHLLIDGQPMGKLPPGIRDSETVKELFGNQRLFTLPSDLPGMSHVLAIDKEGFQIHLGYRNQQLLVRARRSNKILELIPRQIFGKPTDLDLPAPMVLNCVHWLDLSSGNVEIRQHPRIWKDTLWKISLSTRKAYRGETALVDPRSGVYKSIAQIFRDFEEPLMLTVVQPPRRSLTVEIKRMDLKFSVNKKGFLQCKQLAAEIDPNQDAGTLYGLQSMLVLRNVANRSQRSIISPMGRVVYRREGMHVLVKLQNSGSYARYAIDNVLGRLRSAPELRLLYNMAQLHALTSCFIPDPLTDRTGTEEALYCLQSGNCQPWAPLDPILDMEILKTLASLAPQREYYPRDKKCQQIVKWNPQLTTTIQHDAYQGVVDSIIAKSERLALFQPGASKSDHDSSVTVPLLRKRAFWRRSIYERSGVLATELVAPSDLPYIARDLHSDSKRTSHVREVVTLLRQRPHSVHTTSHLIQNLQGYPSIGGYEMQLEPCLLEECLSTDLGRDWGGLVKLCMASEPDDSYYLMFILGLIAFGSEVKMSLLKVVVAFFLLEELESLNVPEGPKFIEFEENAKPKQKTVQAVVSPYCAPYQGEQTGGKKKRKQNAENLRRLATSKEEHSERCEQECQAFSSLLVKQWPCVMPSTDGFQTTYLDLDKAWEAVFPEWMRMYTNLRLCRHLKEVQAILDRHSTSENVVCIPSISIDRGLLGDGMTHNYYLPRLSEELMRKRGPHLDTCHFIGSAEKSHGKIALRNMLAAPEVDELAHLITTATQPSCPVQSSYGQDLQDSLDALRHAEVNPEQELGSDFDFVKEIRRVNQRIDYARALADRYRAHITRSLSQDDPSYGMLKQGNLWPCMNPVSILQQLRSTSNCVFGPGMKDSLVAYGLAIVELQHLIRVKEAVGRRDGTKLHQERNSSRHVNWNPPDYPDWLLLEIEANMQIREEQVTVALEMISPRSGSNSVLQMNMGKGKTSVIMPMVAAVLADGKMLNRLLVPTALLTQTAQILQSRLGCLLGREITYIPFSRRTPTTENLIGEYRKLHEDMLHGSGIILGIPEHALSFKLSGLQRVSDSKIPEAVKMITTQNWINRVCRDILDECDFTLAVKTQLIYPSGSQLTVDGHPNRWEVTMAILGLVGYLLRELAKDYPHSLDVVDRELADFPMVYFLRKDVERALVEKVVDNLCSDQSWILPMRECTFEEQTAIRAFISRKKVDRSVVEQVSTVFPEQSKSRKNVYLLRGLLVQGILLLCLKKRWNVQYGLHPRRDPMAVPFHAKGVPSEQAEWGHPDVAIIFTCLSFYHEGLGEHQLKQALQAVLKSFDPAAEYDRWTQASASLPEPLRHWNIINVDDQCQVAEIWRHLRLTIVVINYFLRHFVFPIHAKQWSIKLQASGWDIPAYYSAPESATDKSKGAGRTTGFSGTNDNRRLLPLTIQQHDLPGLLHTNAEVLTYLLQRRNRQYVQAAYPDGRRFSEMGLLEYLTRKGIRILIDAGAMILEMDNHTLARNWLQRDVDAQAAVYFGPDNKPWVQYKAGKCVPLLATPFADNMEACLVYLDEAHTRGTDLKLPPKARGALTLGLNQTKDHTVQAAMRLRQLGTTQSITFIAPPEVHQSILDVRDKGSSDRLDSADVIAWLLDQTCKSNRELQSLYSAQGTDFCHRMQAATSYSKFLSNADHQKSYLEVLRQPEQQTLEQLYEPRCRKDDGFLSSPVSVDLQIGGKLTTFMQQLTQIQQRSGVEGSNANSALEEAEFALEEVEQEREVAYEIEEEREVERPRVMKALNFPGLNDDIRRFLDTGLLSGTTGYMAASTILGSTQLGMKYGIDVAPLVRHLYVSAEFTRTVKLRPGEKLDNLIRPVNWLLWNMHTEVAMVIIPEEAEEVLSIIRDTDVPIVRLLLYAAPFTKRMLHFNRLDYYSIPGLPEQWTPPTWLPFELGILAGRLYFEFAEYSNLVARLGLKPETAVPALDTETSNASELSIQSRTSQTRTILRFLQEWLTVRRQGQDISHTPMGYICQGWKLRSDHPFFLAWETGGQTIGTVLGRSSDNTSDDDGEVYYDSDEGEDVRDLEDGDVSGDESEVEQIGRQLCIRSAG